MIGYTALTDRGLKVRASWIDETAWLQIGDDAPGPLPAHALYVHAAHVVIPEKLDAQGNVIQAAVDDDWVTAIGAFDPVRDCGLLIKRKEFRKAVEELSHAGLSTEARLFWLKQCVEVLPVVHGPNSIYVAPDGTVSWVRLGGEWLDFLDGRPSIPAGAPGGPDDTKHPLAPDARKRETWNGELVVIVQTVAGWTLADSGVAPEGHSRLLLKHLDEAPLILWDTPTSYVSTPPQLAVTADGPIVALNNPNDKASYFLTLADCRPFAPYVPPVKPLPEIVLNRPVHLVGDVAMKGTATWSTAPGETRPVFEGTSKNKQGVRWSSFIRDDQWLMPFYDIREASPKRQNDPGAFDASVALALRLRLALGIYDDDGPKTVDLTDAKRVDDAGGEGVICLPDYLSQSEGFFPGPCFERVDHQLTELGSRRVFLMVRIDTMLGLATKGQIEQVLLNVRYHINAHDNVIGIAAFGFGRPPAWLWEYLKAIWNALVAANEKARKVEQSDGSIVIRPLPSLRLPAPVVVPPIVVVTPPTTTPPTTVPPKTHPKTKHPIDSGSKSKQKWTVAAVPIIGGLLAALFGLKKRKED